MRISTKSAAAREAYVYSLFAKKPDLSVKEAIARLVANKKLGPTSMGVNRVYQIRELAATGAGLAPKVKGGNEYFGGVTGSIYKSAEDLTQAAA